MTHRPEFVGPGDNMESVRRIFEKRGFHHIPVVEDERLIGLVSYTDYLRVIRDLFHNSSEARVNEKVLGAMCAREVMTENVLCLSPNDDVEAAMRIFKANQFHSLPVVDKDKKLVGIVTTYDVLKVLERIFASNRETITDV